MKCKILLSALALLLACTSFAKIESIMLGSISTREAKLWIKAKPKGVVTISLNDAKSPYSIKVQADEFGIAHATLTNLKPATKYTYTVSDSDGVEESSLETLGVYNPSDPVGFSVAVIGKNFASTQTKEASKAEAEEEAVDDFEIYNQILKLNPISTIWANGIDILNEEEFSSKSGFFSRYMESRKHPKLQNLLRGSSNIGVMAIDNYGAKKADGTMYNKEIAQNAFMRFWQNPSYGQSKAPDNAMYTQFKINDAEFFILDDCSFRDNFAHKKKERSFLGSRQLNFLVQALNASTANFKVVVMNTAIANPSDTYDNFSDAKNEKATVFERIESLKIKGVICVSANKNYAEITKMVRPSAYPIYDITVGPTTAKTTSTINEVNYFRLKDSAVFEKTFCILNFSGKADNRVLNIGFVNKEGALRFKHAIKLSELQ